MSLSSLSSLQLSQLIHLIKERKSLEAKLVKVNQRLETLNGKPVTAKSPPGKKRGRRRAKLKDRILKTLTAAGKAGITVKELASTLKANPASVSVWFYTTGKKIKGVKKVGKATFAYIAGA